MGGCRSDGGARHTEVYGTQECRAHRGTYGAQKGAASIGVLGVQALLQQLLAEGWRCAGKQFAGAEPCRDAGASLPSGTPSPLKCQGCLLGDKGWMQATEALSSPSLLPPHKPAVPALLPTNSCASLVSCFIRESH